MQNTIREELKWIAYFIASIWVVHLIDVVLPIDFNDWGLRPRSLSGLVGIPLMPFLHMSWSHLIGNSIPLVILLVLLAGSKADSISLVIGIAFLGGALLWGFGRDSIHVGASGLVYGLVSFLIASGFLERRFVPLLIAIAVGFFYGTTMIWGLLPFVNKYISWDGHLAGALAGFLMAYWAIPAKDVTNDTVRLDDRI